MSDDTTDEAAAERPPTSVPSVPAERRKPPVHADGIYFDLDEETYHADVALGSSDMNKLSYDPQTYWFESGHNTVLRDADEEEDVKKRTLAQIKGTAVHVFVLYGRDEFERRYAPRYFHGSTLAGKAENKRIAEAGQIGLVAKSFERILQSGTMITANPYLQRAFSGGRAEVSVFWTKDGIRRKGRFDYLKQRAVVDLKSITNSRRIDFKAACRRAINDFGYLVQAEHYREGREAMLPLVKAGAVGGDVNMDWLTKVASEAAWAWVWCFWQASGAPLTKAYSVSPANFGIRDEGRVLLSLAEDNYRRNLEAFGLDTPWVISEPVEELDVSELPYRRVAA
jgi:hypothetical protein